MKSPTVRAKTNAKMATATLRLSAEDLALVRKDIVDPADSPNADAVPDPFHHVEDFINRRLAGVEGDEARREAAFRALVTATAFASQKFTRFHWRVRDAKLRQWFFDRALKSTADAGVNLLPRMPEEDEFFWRQLRTRVFEAAAELPRESPLIAEEPEPDDHLAEEDLDPGSFGTRGGDPDE